MAKLDPATEAQLARIIETYREYDRRVPEVLGIGGLISRHETVRRALEKFSYEELLGLTEEIKGLAEVLIPDQAQRATVEFLLSVDYELRKLHNLKRTFERSPSLTHDDDALAPKNVTARN